MIKSTLCYIEKNNCYLMLFRNKKEHDPCDGKWVGIGGKFEPGEDAEQCLLREVWEETGLRLTEYKFHGIIHFKSDVLPDEDMYLYTASEFEGTDPVAACYEDACFDAISEIISPENQDDEDIRIIAGMDGMSETGMTNGFICSEGDLMWIPKNQVTSLNLWEGDKYFLEPLIAGAEHIEMTCVYEGDRLVSVSNEAI